MWSGTFVLQTQVKAQFMDSITDAISVKIIEDGRAL